jgi:hypothetical protein
MCTIVIERCIVSFRIKNVMFPKQSLFTCGQFLSMACSKHMRAISCPESVYNHILPSVVEHSCGSNK